MHKKQSQKTLFLSEFQNLIQFDIYFSIKNSFKKRQRIRYSLKKLSSKIIRINKESNSGFNKLEY